MSLVLILHHKSICITESLGKPACKEVCDVKPGLDPCPLLAQSWNRWWLDFVTFIAYKKVKIKFKMAKCVSNRCNDLIKRKKYFGFWCTLKFYNQCKKNCRTFILQQQYLRNLDKGMDTDKDTVVRISHIAALSGEPCICDLWGWMHRCSAGDSGL